MKREQVGVGLYKDAYGIDAWVSVKRQRRYKRFPLDTPKAIMEAWQDDQRRILKRSMKPTAKPGSFGKDLERYLRDMRHLASIGTLRATLGAWKPLIEHMPRWSITKADVTRARGEWHDDGIAAKTINNRVHALRAMWHELDGRKAPTPCDEVADLAVPKSIPYFISDTTIHAVTEKLIASERTLKGAYLAHARIDRAVWMVYATTGVRPSEIDRAIASDVNVDAGWWKTRDGKGGFRPGGIALTEDMKAAWELFIEVEAWGKVDTERLARRLRRTGKWPKGVDPYQLRHTVGMTLAEAGADLADIAAQLGHTRPLTTRSHYVPIMSGRMKKVSGLLEGRLGWKRRTG